MREVATALRKMGLNVGEMHSDLTQSERDEIMFLYKSRKVDLLVATDILARGIDIDDIRIVINYDVPGDQDDYIHRVGRTARANAKGRGITLVSEKDQIAFKRIEDFIGKSIEKMPLPDGLGDAPEYSPVKNKNSRQNNKRRKKHNPSSRNNRSEKKGASPTTPNTPPTEKKETNDKINKRRRNYKPKNKGTSTTKTGNTDSN